MASSSSSPSRTWRYDVFPSFRGEDIRKNFLAHFRKELGRSLISNFKDNDTDKGQSLDPVLKQAIKDSRIAIVIFTENYASSAWCLNEMLEIVNNLDQIVIPVFFGVEPTDVRNQTGKFGSVFKKTCKGHKKTKDKIRLWREALKDVANLTGFDSKNWENDAKLIEDIVSLILKELLITPSNDFKDYVGIKDHFEKMSELLEVESKEVRTVGIWGPSGIGKTTIARALSNGLSRQFEKSIFIDGGFISENLEFYRKANSDDYNMKLSLQGKFLSLLLGTEEMKIDHLETASDRLKHHKVLVCIDDLADTLVLEALAGKDQWFGPGSRIIVVTKDKHILRRRKIEHIYEVGFPSEKVALQIFCQAAFEQSSPPDGFLELASKVAERAGGLPLGLRVLGASLLRRDEESLITHMSGLLKDLDKTIEKTLRFSYEGLESSKHKALFRHIACLFNGDEVNYIKLMLADSELNVDMGLDYLVDKSLIRLRPSGNNTNTVEMHCLVQEMGKAIVSEQSARPGDREFLMDSKDVRTVLGGCSGTEMVIGISVDLDEVGKVEIDEDAFKRMRNLRFVRFYKKSLELKKEVKYDLPETIKKFPKELKLLSWPGYPMKCMPSRFCPEYLVELRMPNSKLEELWKGVDEPLTCLRDMDLSESIDLKEIPDLSTATNLETLNLSGCSSLVELPSTRNLNKLRDLNITGCSQLKGFPDISSKVKSIIANRTTFKTFPSTMRLENLVELCMEQTMSERLWDGAQPLTSLKKIVLSGSQNLKEIPDLSMATRLKTLHLNGCSSLVELTPWSIKNLNKLTDLNMAGCTSLQTLPAGINLESLYRLNFNGCSQLKSFPDISNNITTLYLNQTGIEEVPPWINNFSNLESLEMWECNQLQRIASAIFHLENLLEVFFSDCAQLAHVKWPEETEDTNNTASNFSLISFTNCFNSNHEAFIQISASKYLILPGDVSPYFTHRSTSSSLKIDRHRSSLSQQSFLDFKACVVVSDLVTSEGSETVNNKLCFIDIEVHCRFIDQHGNDLDTAKPRELSLHLKYNHQIIFDCHFPLNQECDQVEIEFRLPNKRVKVKGCGMRLSDDSTPLSVTQSEVDPSIADDVDIRTQLD